MSQPKNRRSSLLAMVLGTALATLGGAGGVQAREGVERSVLDIHRYCAACWRNARLPLDRWGDCTQEVFRRLLERVPTTEWAQLLTKESEKRREFIRAIDAVKKRTQRDQRRYTSLTELAVEGRQSPSHDEREEFRKAARELLSARQQHILQRLCEGYAINDIAEELNLPAARISDEKYKGVQKLKEHFQGREI